MQPVNSNVKTAVVVPAQINPAAPRASRENPHCQVSFSRDRARGNGPQPAVFPVEVRVKSVVQKHPAEVKEGDGRGDPGPAPAPGRRRRATSRPGNWTTRWAALETRPNIRSVRIFDGRRRRFIPRARSRQAAPPQLAQGPFIFRRQLLRHAPAFQFRRQDFPSVGFHLQMRTQSRPGLQSIQHPQQMIGRRPEPFRRRSVQRNVEMNASLGPLRIADCGLT